MIDRYFANLVSAGALEELLSVKKPILSDTVQCPGVLDETLEAPPAPETEFLASAGELGEEFDAG